MSNKMNLSVYFVRHDYKKMRVCYRGIGEQHNSLYYVHNGIWFDASNKVRIKSGIKLTVHDATGIIGTRIT
jgi:hypothetical protein